MNTGLKRALIVFLPFIMLLTIACNLFAPKPEAQPIAAVVSPIVTETILVPVPTLPAPLEDVPFPDQPIQLPTEWPAELTYPQNFIVVDASSGSSPVEAASGWSTKMRYSGAPQNAAADLEKFLQSNGWTVKESNLLDSGGMVSVLAKGSSGNGIVIIDPDPSNPAASIIISTLFP